MTDPTTASNPDPTVDVVRDLRLITDLADIADDHIDDTGRQLFTLSAYVDLDKWAAKVAADEREHLATCPLGRGGDHRRCRLADGRPYDWRALDGDDDDHLPPLHTLLYWTDALRDELGTLWQQRVDGRPLVTIQTEAIFLRDNIAHLHQHEPHFADLARDIRRVRARLEDLLSAGARADRSVARCFHCPDEPRLVRVWNTRRQTGARCVACGTPVHSQPSTAEQLHAGNSGSDGERPRDHCPNPWCHTVAPPEPTWTSDETADYWRCPACRHHYDDVAYKLARLHGMHAAVMLRRHEAVTLLTDLGRSRKTVHAWLQPHVERAGDLCTVCGHLWPDGEYAACPAEIPAPTDIDPDGVDECGGELVPWWTGDREDVITGWCDLATSTTWYSWPDLWARHRSTPTRRRSRAS